MSTSNANRRRRPRISTMILCEIIVGMNPPELARVRDLSECGMKIATPRPLVLGERVRIRLPGTDCWVLARVSWCMQGTAGLAFSRAIDMPGVSGAQLPREALLRDAFATRRQMAG